jgi:anti-anti-sigma regulatory factor
MFRITTQNVPGAMTIKLEGKLAGPWVQEAEACLQHTLASPHQPSLRFDLTGVTLIDAAGKAFLASAHARGAQLTACGCLMRAIVAEITHSPKNDGACR